MNKNQRQPGWTGQKPSDGFRRPHLSKFYVERVQKARLYPDRTFHFLVSLRRLAAWGLGPEPSVEAIAHERTVRRRMATMNQNKGKDVVDEVAGQARPSAGDKRKALSKTIDLGKLPSRRKEKRVKHGPSKTGVVQSDSAPPVQQTPVQVHDVEDEFIDPPSRHTPSTIQMPVSPQPSSQVPLTLLEDEDLAWGRFERVVTDQDVAACYNMSLKDFEHSGVHDLFKAMSKFIAASRQATQLDKTRILLEKRVQEVKDESKRWAGVAGKAKDEVKELQNLVEELKADAIEKDTRLDHLQKRNDELSALLEKAKGDAVADFKASKEYTDSLDTNYAAGFEDFRMDAVEKFPDLDFSSIKLSLGGATSSSLLQTSSEDINVEDDATTQHVQDDPSTSPPQ